jgi:hypothetical protein
MEGTPVMVGCQEQNREGEGRESESGDQERVRLLSMEDEVEGIAASSP